MGPTHSPGVGCILCTLPPEALVLKRAVAPSKNPFVLSPVEGWTGSWKAQPNGACAIKPITDAPSSDDALFAEANAWFFRLRANDAGVDEHEAFADWLSASPRHAEAWDAVQELFTALEQPAKSIRRLESPNPKAEPAGETGRQTRIRSGFQSRRAFAATLACACLLLVFLQSAVLENLQSDYHTAVGEQRRIELADGSRVLLNTDSAASIEMRGNLRKVRLLRGEAFFEVAHAPQRPFWVEAGTARARVTGTAFGVSRDADRVSITVAEGRVETSADPQAELITPLAPGETALYQDRQLISVRTADLQHTLAWRQGQMVFEQATLAEVVEQINRYRPGRLIITDDRLKNRPITAVFAVNRLDEAVTALEQTFGIRARRLADYWVFLG